MYWSPEYLLCTFQHFPQVGERRNSKGELDDVEKSVSYFPPIGKNLVSKITWVGHQIFYIIYSSGNKELASLIHNYLCMVLK